MAFRPGYTPMYHEGNDYKQRPIEEDWDPTEYSAGNLVPNDPNYISGGWNLNFRTVLPQQDWKGVGVTKPELEKFTSAYYSPDYATASAIPASAWEKYKNTNYTRQ